MFLGIGIASIRTNQLHTFFLQIGMHSVLFFLFSFLTMFFIQNVTNVRSRSFCAQLGGRPAVDSEGMARYERRAITVR
jgi:hypothetical protein